MKNVFTSLLVVGVLASALFAAEELTGISLKDVAVQSEGKTCPASCESACAKGCPIDAAMAKLPKMTYKVATEQTCCADAAAKLAKEHNAEIKFVVADKTFEAKNEAMTALVAATEKFVSDFTTTSHCSASKKYTVAGKELCCEVMAGERAELAKKAMKSVEMAYLVGDKECHCPNEAASLAKTSGKEKLFVVAGEKTCCSTTARLKLAQAKYKAAIEALAKTDAPATTEKS